MGGKAVGRVGGQAGGRAGRWANERASLSAHSYAMLSECENSAFVELTVSRLQGPGFQCEIL